MDFEFGFSGLPATAPFSENVECKVAPPPTSVETLRHIADTISGDGAVIMQGILRKAADELEMEKARLDFLIANPVKVGRFSDEWTLWKIGYSASGLSSMHPTGSTPREAIDIVMRQAKTNPRLFEDC